MKHQMCSTNIVMHNQCKSNISMLKWSMRMILAILPVTTTTSANMEENLDKKGLKVNKNKTEN